MLKNILPFLFLFLGYPSFSQQTVGLFLNDSLSQNGYTLFSRNTNTFLIDNCGFEVHRWESEFISNSSAYLLENGDLLRTCRVSGTPFNAGGIAGRIELFNWENDLLWAYDYASDEHHSHHDVEPLPNGNILILAWDRYTEEQAESAGRLPNTFGPSGLWPEKIVEVEMVGTDEINVVWEWKLWDHLVQDISPFSDNFGNVSEHPELVDINAMTEPNGTSDWIHANAVSYNEALDQIAISSRHLDEVWVIDHSTTTQEAAGHTGGNMGKGGDLLYRFGNPEMYGRGTAASQMFYGQHDVRWLPEGHPQAGKMMVFNNGQDRFPDGDSFSSVDIWEPPVDADGNYIIGANEPFGPTELEWTYSDQNGFSSPNVSGAHGLPNGNIFICEGREGRIFEVTQSGEIVWEYINPVTALGPISQGQTTGNNGVFRATRYTAAYPAFDGRDLSPGAPLEMNPFTSDCVIFADEPVAAHEQKLERIFVRQNPFSDFLRIENASGERVGIQVFDGMGRPVFQSNSVGQHMEIETAGWPKGMYVLSAVGESNGRGFSKKLMKF